MSTTLVDGYKVDKAEFTDGLICYPDSGWRAGQIISSSATRSSGRYLHSGFHGSKNSTESYKSCFLFGMRSRSTVLSTWLKPAALRGQMRWPNAECGIRDRSGCCWNGFCFLCVFWIMYELFFFPSVSSWLFVWVISIMQHFWFYFCQLIVW